MTGRWSSIRRSPHGSLWPWAAPRDLGGWPGARLGLSQRESDVLALLVDGLANREIAERLFVGQETVKTHLHSLYRKLAVRDRAGAVGLALRDGIFN